MGKRKSKKKVEDEAAAAGVVKPKSKKNGKQKKKQEVVKKQSNKRKRDEIDDGFISMDRLHAASASDEPKQKGFVDNGDEHETSYNIPWIGDKMYSNKNMYLRLHEEILDFVEFLSPTDPEKAARRSMYEDMKDIVHLLWPEAEIRAFGSSLTEMYLPTSDVDMVVLDAPQGKNTLYRLARYMQDHDYVTYMEVVAQARVPIVKFTHKKTGIHADVSFGHAGGLKSAELIKSYMCIYPAFRPLAIVLKYFLAQRNLNETFQGGIGSYLLQLMIISYLQHYSRTQARSFVNCSMRNLGHLLIGFFELYGCKFNYERLSIEIRKGGRYVLKRDTNFESMRANKASALSVQNPLDLKHDVAANSHDIQRIRRIFEYTYQVLRSEILAHGSNPRPRRQKSILSSVITVDAFLSERTGPEYNGFPMIEHNLNTKKKKKKKKNQSAST